MRIYIHHGAGHYIGSKVIVLATNHQQAIDMIRKQLGESGLKNEEIKHLVVVEIDKPCIVLSDNGDY